LPSLFVRIHESYSRSRVQGETIGQKRDPRLGQARESRAIRTNDRDLVLSDDAAIGHQGV
jgi:hypothetical protein